MFSANIHGRIENIGAPPDMPLLLALRDILQMRGQRQPQSAAITQKVEAVELH
jgi:hypothetical protein